MFTLTLKRKQSLRALVAQVGATVEFDDCGDYTAVQVIAPEGYQWEQDLFTLCHPTNNYDTFNELFYDVKSRISNLTKITRYADVLFINGDAGYEHLELLDTLGGSDYFNYLQDSGYLDQPVEELETRDTPFWGTSDHVVYFDNYVLSYNFKQGYVAVTAII